MTLQVVSEAGAVIKTSLLVVPPVVLITPVVLMITLAPTVELKRT